MNQATKVRVTFSKCGLLSYWRHGFVFVDDLQMRKQVRGQDRSSAARARAARISRGSAAKLKHLARELFICCCVRIEHFSNARDVRQDG